MSSISIKTGVGRRNKSGKKVQKQAQEPQATQTFPVFGIMVMIGILGFFALLLFSQPAASLANISTGIAPQTLSLSGAVTSRIDLETAAVTCASTGIVVNGTAPMAYSLNYATANRTVSSNLSLDGANTLSLSINSAIAGTGSNVFTAYDGIVTGSNVFTAYDGVVYTQNGRTYVNAFLSNDSGQLLYINSTFACN